jgi:hypothetical protein
MLIAGIGSPQSVGPTSGGKTTPVNNVATGGALVIAANPARVSIMFHNPGTQTLYVYPAVTATGAANTPALASLGGSYQLLPGGYLTFAGECQTAWGAFAAVGASNALSISESNV